jgi:hydroxymethylglutaryl-CoA reductase
MTASSQIDTACATAPGKVILLGEHAVVYGRTALAAAIDRYVTVHVACEPAPECRADDVGSERKPLVPRFSTYDPRPSPVDAEPRLAQAITRAADIVGLNRKDLVTTIFTDLPVAMGLGSSAALSVALVRALARLVRRPLVDQAVCQGAFEIEKIFHGFPSGVDNTVATYGGLIAFTRATAPRRLDARRSLPLVVALGRAPRRTQQTVVALRRRWEANPADYEALFDEIAALVRHAERAIASGDLATLGAAMSANHAVLQRLEVPTDELDQMVTLAATHGALGAKLTGGGGGGAVICLCDGDRDGLVDAFARAGWQAFATDIGATQRGVYAADRTASVDEHAAPRG